MNKCCKMLQRLLLKNQNSLIPPKISINSRYFFLNNAQKSLFIGQVPCRKCISTQRRFLHFTPTASISDRDYQELKAWRQLFRKSGLLTGNGSIVTPYGNFMPGSCRFSTSSPLNQQDNKDDVDEEDKEKDGNQNNWMQIGMLLLFTILLLDFMKLTQSKYATVTWSEFVNDLVLKGEVKQAISHHSQSSDSDEGFAVYITLHEGATFKGMKGPLILKLNMSNASQFEENLRKVEDSIGIKPGEGIPVHYRRLSYLQPLLQIGAAALLIIILRLAMKGSSASSLQTMLRKPFTEMTQAKYTRADVLATGKKGVSFKDVAGLHEAKVEIIEFVDYLKNPQRFQNLGAKVPKGALLTGPPGCGKTLLAKALASEAQVPFLVMAGSEFVEVIGGLGASRVRSLFKDARSKAPCIIYVDEIDAIGKKRGNMSGGDEEQTLNQLLVELDGMGTEKGVLMLASTNRAEVLDKALLRPGRFDRHISIDLPTLAERKEIFEMYLGKLKLSQPVTDYSERLSQLSPGMSGADISNICNEAALFAARNSKSLVESSDFDYAVERVLVGATKKSRVLSVKEKRVIAYHEAGHALVGWLLQHTDQLLRVSIVQRTNATLGFAQYSPQDRHLHSKDELFEKMCMALGGRVAESLTFNHVTSGAQDDLRKVTKMANMQVRSLGMSEVVGHLSFPTEEEEGFAKRPYSKRLATLMDQEATSLVAKAYKSTERLLKENTAKLQVIAEALLEKEVLTYDDMEELIGPPPHDKKVHLPDWKPEVANA